MKWREGVAFDLSMLVSPVPRQGCYEASIQIVVEIISE